MFALLKPGVHDVKVFVIFVVIYIYAIIFVWCPLEPVIYRKPLNFAAGIRKRVEAD